MQLFIVIHCSREGGEVGEREKGRRWAGRGRKGVEESGGRKGREVEKGERGTHQNDVPYLVLEPPHRVFPVQYVL